MTTFLDQVTSLLGRAQEIAEVTPDPWRRQAIVLAAADVWSVLQDSTHLLRYSPEPVAVLDLMTSTSVAGWTLFQAYNGPAWVRLIENRLNRLAEALQPVAPEWAEVATSAGDQAATAAEQAEEVLATQTPGWAKVLAAVLVAAILWRVSGGGR